METFHQTIRLGVVRRRHDDLYTPSLCQLGEKTGRKLRTAVRRDCRRCSIRCYPAVGEGIGDVFGSHVDHGNGNGPTSISVDRRQQISESVGTREGDDVEVYVRKASVGHFEVADRRNRILCHFGFLTAKTFSRPTT